MAVCVSLSRAIAATDHESLDSRLTSRAGLSSQQADVRRVSEMVRRSE